MHKAFAVAIFVGLRVQACSSNPSVRVEVAAFPIHAARACAIVTTADTTAVFLVTATALAGAIDVNFAIGKAIQTLRRELAFHCAFGFGLSVVVASFWVHATGTRVTFSSTHAADVLLRATSAYIGTISLERIDSVCLEVARKPVRARCRGQHSHFVGDCAAESPVPGPLCCFKHHSAGRDVELFRNLFSDRQTRRAAYDEE